MKKRFLVLSAKLACAVLISAMHVILFVGTRVERSRRFLGPIGSRLAGATLALSEFGKRHC